MRHAAVGLAFVTALVAGCDAAPESALAPSLDRKERVPNQEHVRTPVSRTVSNPCPPVPEMVQVEGWQDFHSHFKHFEGGNTSRHDIKTQASGVGLTTGLSYTFHELWHQDAEYDIDSQHYEGDQVTRWHVISQTGLGNFFATSRQHFVCDGSVCRTELISIETDCRG